MTVTFSYGRKIQAKATHNKLIIYNILIYHPIHPFIAEWNMKQKSILQTSKGLTKKIIIYHKTSLVENWLKKFKH